MSQSANYIGEAELPGVILQHLGLKFPKEAFSKPNQATLIEIYSAFLDKTVPYWRSTINPNLGTPVPRICSFVKRITSRYNIEYEFKLEDLIEPERRRTTVFINVLLLFSAHHDERSRKMDQWKTQLQEKQAENFKIKDTLRYLREERERRALEIGQLKTIQEAEQDKKVAQERFLAEQARGDKLTKTKDDLKAKLHKLQIQNKEKSERLNSIEVQIKEKKNILEKANELTQLEQDLCHMKQLLEEKKLTAGIKQNNFTAALEKIRRDKATLLKEMAIEREQSLFRTSEMKRKLTEIHERQKIRAETTQSQKERAKKKLEALETKAKESMQLNTKGYNALNDYRLKFDQLIGCNKPSSNENCDSSVNRTFIKSSNQPTA